MGGLVVVRRRPGHIAKVPGVGPFRREDQEPSRVWGESATRHDPIDIARSGAVARRRWPVALAAAAIFMVSLLVPSAGNAAPDTRAAAGGPAVQGFPAANSPGELARLEARAARLSRQYRGQLVTLADAQNAARQATAKALRLRRQLSQAHRELARLAAASYMGGVRDPLGAVFGGGDPRRALEAAATAEYVVQQRSARQHALAQFMATEQQAEQAARAKVGELRRMVASLVSQRRRVDALMAKFRPESPVVGGDGVTPRMRSVRDEVDRRFGPFSSIGCVRAEVGGEHPLGRACDFMLSTGGVMPSASDVQRGYDIASWAQANASRLGIMYIIYRQRIWDIRNASAGWQPMADRGSITANHFDHVHISVF